MRQWATRSKTAAICLISTISLGSCAAASVKWWFNDAKDAQALVRRKCADKQDPKTCEIIERMSYVEADGYFCVSPADAELIINLLRQK